MEYTRDEVEADAIHLANTIHAQLGRIERLIGQEPVLNRTRVLGCSYAVVRSLADCDANAASSARHVLDLLFADDLPPVEWWTTRLGQDVAWAIGFPQRGIPAATYGAAILGITKSAVYKLIQEDRLHVVPDTSPWDVTRSSLLEFLHRRGRRRRRPTT